MPQIVLFFHFLNSFTLPFPNSFPHSLDTHSSLATLLIFLLHHTTPPKLAFIVVLLSFTMNRQTLLLFQLQYLSQPPFSPSPHLPPSLSRLLTGWRGSWTIRYHFLTHTIHSHHTTPLVCLSLPYRLYTLWVALVLQVYGPHSPPLPQYYSCYTLTFLLSSPFHSHT